MKEFDFTLKFALPDNAVTAESYLESLAAAGCDDALIGIGQTGRIALQFLRRSDNALNAVISAIKDVKRAIPGAKLIEATPDLVGLSDIADILGFTRQNVRKLMISHQTFPAPVHAGSPDIWHLSTVLRWFSDVQNRIIDSSMMDIALVNMQVNLAKESRHLNQKFQSKLASLAL